MKEKVMRVFDYQHYEQFVEFLLEVEIDIAVKHAPFDMLEGVFIDLFERPPRED